MQVAEVDEKELAFLGEAHWKVGDGLVLSPTEQTRIGQIAIVQLRVLPSKDAVFCNVLYDVNGKVVMRSPEYILKRQE